MNEGLQEFYREYLQEIVSTADAEGDFRDAAFVENMGEFLEDQGYFEECSYIGFVKRPKGIKADAWAYNETNCALTLLVADFRGPTENENIPTISETDVDKNFRRLENFWANSRREEFIEALEESTPAYSLIYQLTKGGLEVKSLRMILITNALLSGRVSDSVLNARKNAETEIPSSYEVWDLGRLYTVKSSTKAREDIVIDCTKVESEGIPCLQASSTEYERVQVYLMILPGEFLADIYDKYGERLLEQNVRTFLQFRRDINKGIRNTIINSPQMFIAYNNGLTVTAENISLSPDRKRILSIKNLQIVNGGQTTASIFATRSKESIDKIKNVFVQVKLIVIPEENVDQIVPLISEYANTQNKVDPADFFSNHPFHRRIQELSRRLLANPADGNLRGTYWYYERTRGQYNNSMSRLSPSETKRFKMNNPKNQMFTKIDLAKYVLSWEKYPTKVSLGAQKCFKSFASEIAGMWNDNSSQFDERYFHELIGKAFFFKYLDAEIKKQSWYGGFKANIVTYTIAKFKDYLDTNQKAYNLVDVWKRQDIDNETKDFLIHIAKVVNESLKNPPSLTMNITEWCKKTECWNAIRELSLPSDFAKKPSLLSLERTPIDNVPPTKMSITSKREHVQNLGVPYWQRLKKWIEEGNYFSLFDEKNKKMNLHILEMACSGQQLSDKQCNVLINYVEAPMKKTGFR